MLPIFKALSDPTRLSLLFILQHGDFTVQEITRILGMGQSRISRHLKILCEANLLNVQQQGTWRYYSLTPTDDFFLSVWSQIAPRLREEKSELLAQIGQVMEERRRRSLNYFDRHASDWEDIASRLSLPEYQQDILQAVQRSETVVEVGVGSGQLLRALSEIVPTVIGIDHSTEMLKTARTLFGGDEIDLRLGEMGHLPLADQAVDAVVLNQVLHHAEHPQDVIVEIERVLRPGGFLVVADLLRHDYDWVREELADQWLGFDGSELETWLKQCRMRVVTQRIMPATQGEFQVLFLIAERQAHSSETKLKE